MLAPRHTSEIAQRIVQAQADFVETLMSLSGCSKADAEKVFALYRQEQLIKLDAVHGRYSVKHGALLDTDVIRRAIEA